MSKRIYIADEDQALVERLSKKLSSLGHEVMCAHNGRAALDDLNINNVPHLLICGTNMPELNGLELCKEMRKDNRLKKIPVLIMYEKSLFDKPFRDIGIDEFLPKPPDLEKIQNSVDVLLRYGSRSNIPKPKSKFDSGTLAVVIVIVAILVLAVLLIGVNNLPFMKK